MSRPAKIPKPEEVWRKLEHLENVVLPQIIKEYEQAYGYVHDRPDADRKDETGSYTRGGVAHRDRQERVQTSDISDPTASTAIAQSWRLTRVKRVGARLLKLPTQFDAAMNDLMAIYKTSDDDYRPLWEYREEDRNSPQKRAAEKARKKRDKLEELHRLESRAAQLRNELFGRSA